MIRWSALVTALVALCAVACDRSDRCGNVSCDDGASCADLATGAVCVCDVDRVDGPDGGCLVPDAGQ